MFERAKDVCELGKCQADCSCKDEIVHVVLLCGDDYIVCWVNVGCKTSESA